MPLHEAVGGILTESAQATVYLFHRLYFVYRRLAVELVGVAYDLLLQCFRLKAHSRYG